MNILSRGSIASDSGVSATRNMAGKCFLITNGHANWIGDTRATNHMTGKESLLLDKSKVGNARFKFNLLSVF